MTAVLADGEEREFRVGEALTGHEFASVTLTSEDARQPGFLEWFAQVVMGRWSAQ